MNVKKYTPVHHLHTAVLFMVFNRLDTTKQVFQAIREAKPPRLYIACDGVRIYRKDDIEKVQTVRDYVMQNIDWNCEVKTLFQKKNLGCKYAVSSAITWFFENEEMGIILEDDCLPSQSFFWFCEEMLNKYKNYKDIFGVGGTNLISKVNDNNSYIFSLHGTIWGWATWANKWKEYNIDIEKNINYDLLNQYPTTLSEICSFKITLHLIKTTSSDFWDYQWLLTRIKHNGLTILPSVNLITNIGFGHEDSTHTTSKTNTKIKTKSGDIIFPLKHHSEIKRSLNYDKNLWLYKNGFISRIKTIIKFIKLKILNFIIKEKK